MSKRQILLNALEEIANPVKWAMNHLEPGYEIDGYMLNHIVSSPYYYQEIAKKALREFKEEK